MLSLSSKGSTSHEDDLVLENSSASVVASNCDLLKQILLCVPMKPLMLFKCVSTSWLSLFSDPLFVQSYTLRNHRLSNRGLFLHKMSMGGVDPKFEFVFADGRSFTGTMPFQTSFPKESTFVITEQSCNGLICCSSGSREDRDSRIFYIFNPTTSQYRILPSSPSREEGSIVRNVSLAFDLLKSPHYQVVCFLISMEKCIFQIDIYSSKTASWRRSGEGFSNKPFLLTKSGVFWNGSLHWVHVTEYPHVSLKDSFVYFDVDQELLMDMPVPEIPDGKVWDKEKIGYFGECKGHLHLIPNYDEYDGHFYIFEMEDIHYKQWSLKYKVNLEEVLIAYPKTFFDNERICEENELGLYQHLYGYKFSIFLVEEEEGGESLNILIHIPDKIISYDLKNMSFKETHDLPSSLYHTGPAQAILCGAHQHSESLACI